MSRIAATVLVAEAIVIGLAIPVAVGVSDVDPSTAVPVGVVLVVAYVAAAALVRRGSVGYHLGSALQAVAVGIGVVVPVMFVLGGIFALLWFLTLRLGRAVERAEAGRRATDEAEATRPERDQGGRI
ncbi:MAG: DUF4233 domain-containing protein [Jiangellaceae bacterium]